MRTLLVNFLIIGTLTILISCGQEVDKLQPISDDYSQSTTELSAPFINATGNGSFINSNLCSPKIGAGGNYVERGTYLLGKCQGNFVPPRISGYSNRYLNFQTRKSTKSSPKDRIELAWGGVFYFNQKIQIDMRVKLPKGSNITNQHFSFLQLWQCPGKPPIAGIRVKRGTSHTIQFYNRGTVQERQGRPSTKATFNMRPGKFHKFTIVAKVLPKGNGLFKVIADGRTLTKWYGPYGYYGSKICAGGMPTPNNYRVKFGIYKGSERNKVHKVHYDFLRIYK